MDHSVTNKSKIVATFSDDVSWHTTQASLTQEEEDAIVTLVVVVIGITAAIIILFSMGIFIDCRHQNKPGMKKQKMSLKLPSLTSRRATNDDRKTLASEMWANGNSDSTAIRDAIV